MTASGVTELDMPAPLDLEELLARCLGRVDLMDRLLANFDETLGPQINQLEEAVQISDPPKIKSIAHRIKGAALTVSARELSKCAERLESSAVDPSSEQCANCLENVLRECERLSATIRARSQKEICLES
jgi:HPt (histidine-containing phosphotransfer) domain-containing protein